MVISAYLSPGQKFKNVDSDTCFWLKTEFSGAKTTVQRRNVQMDIKIENLKEGDTINTIFDIPDSQSHYTQVNAELIEFLQESGFSQFMVTYKKQSNAIKAFSEGENNTILADLKRSEELRKSKKIKKTTPHRPNKVTVKKSSELLKSLKQSEEARKQASKFIKPIKYNWVLPSNQQKDDFLIQLKKPEENRGVSIKKTGSKQLLVESKPLTPSVYKPSAPRIYYRMTREQQVDQANDFMESMNKSIETRTEAFSGAEDLMDKARQKKVNWSSINYYVDFVIKNSTTTALSALATIKASDQTYGHCVDVAAIFCSTYLGIKAQSETPSVFKDKNNVMLAAFLHDFGKSQIPKDILESDEVFEPESEEMQLMRLHPEFGAKLLHDKMRVPNSFINMARFHHVKKSPNHLNSYPRIKDHNKLPYETKLLSIVDVYQALIGRRSYKNAWSPAAAIHFLKGMAGSEFDAQVFKDFHRVIGDFPIGTLVKLSDQTTGFVVSVPESNLLKPRVVLVKDSKGHDLITNPLVDLKSQKNLHITQDLNTEKVLGKRSFEIFKQITVS